MRQAFLDAGISPEEVDAAFPAEEDAASDEFELWPENAAVYHLFCSLATQWHLVAGFGFVRYVGLRYSSAERLMRGRRFKGRERETFWEDMHVMELAALPVLNDTVKDE